MPEIVFNVLLIFLIALALFSLLFLVLLMVTKENPDEENAKNRYEQVMGRYKDK